MSGSFNVMESGFRRTVGYWLPAFAWMASIVLIPRLLERPVQTALPDPEAQGGQFIRYLIHAAEYGVLALLLTRALRGTTRFRSRVASLWGKSQSAAFIMALAYAVLDELQQGLMPNREPSVADLLADGLGIFLALTAAGCYMSVVAARVHNEPAS